MASPVSALLCALIASGFWTLLGYALARHLLPRVLALGAAAVIGWAAHSAAVLPVYFWIGLSPITVCCYRRALYSRCRLFVVAARRHSEVDIDPAVPPWTIAAAALLAGVLALAPASAIVPKHYGDAVQLADPIFDHAKIAFINAMARLGVPPVNPVFRRIRRTRTPRLLLPLAFQRRRACAGRPRDRLGSRYRADMVHRLCVTEFDDGAGGLAR